MVPYSRLTADVASTSRLSAGREMKRPLTYDLWQQIMFTYKFNDQALFYVMKLR